MSNFEFDTPEPTPRLAQLGLTAPLLWEAVMIGQQSCDTCTDNDPAFFKGMVRFARTLRGLRDVLREYGWTRGRDGGLETVNSPDGRIAITVATGDEGTGVPVGRCVTEPRTKNPKGPSTHAAIAVNARVKQHELFPGSVPSAEVDQKHVTWILLVRSIDGELFCELSLPKATDAYGHVAEWEERIVLRPLPPGDPSTPQDGQPDVDGNDDGDVEVRRRTA